LAVCVDYNVVVRVRVIAYCLYYVWTENAGHENVRPAIAIAIWKSVQ